MDLTKFTTSSQIRHPAVNTSTRRFMVAMIQPPFSFKLLKIGQRSVSGPAWHLWSRSLRYSNNSHSRLSAAKGQKPSHSSNGHIALTPFLPPHNFPPLA